MTLSCTQLRQAAVDRCRHCDRPTIYKCLAKVGKGKSQNVAMTYEPSAKGQAGANELQAE